MAPRVRYEAIARRLAAVRARGRLQLTEPEAKAVLALAGFAVPRERVVKGARDAARAARTIGFPVVMKVVSSDLPHKSDVGGVRLGLTTAAAVAAAYGQMLAAVRARRPDARIAGVAVQRQVRGIEVIVGATVDREFGPVLVFGLGGTAVEAVQDVAFRLVPVDAQDARAMIAEVKGAALLNGHRGARPVDRRPIVAALVRLSGLMARFRGELQGIEINPLLVDGGRAVAADALAVLAPGPDR